MNLLKFSVILLCVITSIFGYSHFFAPSKNLTIGIIVPMEHAALTSIVKGFTDTIEKSKNINHKPIKVIVKNAEGDLNMQQAIIKQFKHNEVDILVPIGTATTQMTAQMEPSIPIVSLAANPNNNYNSPNISYVIDELGAKKPLELLKRIYPNIKKITLLTSQSEKIFHEVAVVKETASTYGIKVQHLSINQMQELLTLSRAIANDSEAIFILKDHLIVSGVKIIATEAKKKNIPVISTDEGSVASGAAFALGVPEYSIGTAGGEIALQTLMGENLAGNTKEITSLKLFYNPTACTEQKVSIADLVASTSKVGFSLEVEQL